MAVLPGIDANDEGKTAAVFQFYTAVLSSIPTLHGLTEEEEDIMSPHGPAAAGDAAFGDFAAGEITTCVELNSRASRNNGTPIHHTDCAGCRCQALWYWSGVWRLFVWTKIT